MLQRILQRFPPKKLIYQMPRMYEWLVYRLLFPWMGMSATQQARLVDEMLQPAGLVLEAPIGTAQITCDLYAARPDIQVVGVDLALLMLRRAQHHLTARGITNVQLVCADMTVLPFADDSFAQIVSMHGLQTLPRPERLVDELLRVAEDGAVVVGTASVDIRGEPRSGLQQLMVRLGLIKPLNAEALHELLGLTWSKLSAQRSGAVYGFQRPKLDPATGTPVAAVDQGRAGTANSM